MEAYGAKRASAHAAAVCYQRELHRLQRRDAALFVVYRMRPSCERKRIYSVNFFFCKGIIFKINFHKRLIRSGKITDRDSALEAIHQRESHQSTGIGKGLAVPHGKDPKTTQLVGAVGISHEGIEYDSIDGQPVQAIILLIAQPDHPGPHVAALAEIAQIFSKPAMRQAFCNAKDAATVMEIIRSVE